MLGVADYMFLGAFNALSSSIVKILKPTDAGVGIDVEVLVLTQNNSNQGYCRVLCCNWNSKKTPTKISCANLTIKQDSDYLYVQHGAAGYGRIYAKINMGKDRISITTVSSFPDNATEV